MVEGLWDFGAGLGWVLGCVGQVLAVQGVLSVGLGGGFRVGGGLVGKVPEYKPIINCSHQNTKARGPGPRDQGVGPGEGPKGLKDQETTSQAMQRESGKCGF